MLKRRSFDSCFNESLKAEKLNVKTIKKVTNEVLNGFDFPLKDVVLDIEARRFFSFGTFFIGGFLRWHIRNSDAAFKFFIISTPERSSW